jgi:hypothetical protein
MPQVSVDFSQVEEYELVPEGDYLVEVDEVETKQSSTGKAMMTLQLTIKEPEEYAGRKLFDNMLLEGKALWRTKRELEALLGDLPKEQVSFDTNDLIGAQCMVYVAHRVWKKEDGGDGEARPDVRKYTSLDEAEFDEDIDDLF